MKLYYYPGACSLSPHIALREAGISFDLVKVDLATHKTEDGRDYYTINPKGSVPALVLDNGEVLTEGPAIVQYIADLVPKTSLAPANGTMERYRLQEVLGYINSEIHKTFAPLFSPNTTEELRNAIVATLNTRFAHVEKTLAKKAYITGDTFTVADGYLFTILNWAGFTKVDLSNYPSIVAYIAKIGARPTALAALKAEGLIA